MKLYTVLTSLAAATLVSSNSFFGGNQKVVANDDDLSVPGENPLNVREDTRKRPVDMDLTHTVLRRPKRQHPHHRPCRPGSQPSQTVCQMQVWLLTWTDSV